MITRISQPQSQPQQLQFFKLKKKGEMENKKKKSLFFFFFSNLSQNSKKKNLWDHLYVFNNINPII